MPRPLDITGHRYGNLTAVRLSRRVDSKRIWLFECDCGNLVELPIDRVRHHNKKDCGCLLMRPGESAFNAIVGKMRSKAKQRGLIFNLDRKTLLTLLQSDCTYCGAAPNQGGGKQYDRLNGKFLYNGLDRLDSSLGYTADNVLPCCGTCNRAKSDTSVEEFKRWVRAVYGRLCK